MTRIHDKHGGVLTDSTGLALVFSLNTPSWMRFRPDLVGAQK